jgi:phenylpyruvate tautomerase PptA (4-oxalocrotonate tautomerase family)
VRCPAPTSARPPLPPPPPPLVAAVLGPSHGVRCACRGWQQIEEQAAACPSQPQPQPAPAQVPVSAPSPTGAPADPLVSMRQLLAEAVANLDGKIAATTTEMDTRCENLEQWVGEVEERVISTVKAASQPSDSGSRTEAHEKRLLALESQLSGLHASGGGAGQASVVAVAEGLSSVQAAVGELDAKLAQLHAQLGSLETTQVETARTAAVSLDGLRSELAQTASAVAAGVGPRVVSLEAQLAQISASTTGDTPATETVLPAIATLEAKLATLETSQSKSSESAAVAIRDLQSAVRQLAVASSAGDGVAAESAERHAQGVSGGSGDDDDAEAAAQQLGARVEDCIRRKVEEFRGLRVGDYCEVATDSCQGRGVVAFTGQTAFKDGAWVGVRLDQPLGKNNGAVQGQRYFTCQEGHGVFVPPDRVRRITASEAVAGALALEREAQSAAVERLRDECKQYQEACNTTVGSMEASWGGRCSSVEELLRELDGRTQDHGETLRAAQQQLEGLSDRVDRDLQAGMIQRFEGAMDAAKAELAKQVTEMQGRFTDMESCIAAVKPGPLGAQVESVVARQLDAHSTRLGDVERGLNASLVQMQSELVATAKSVKELTADSGAQDIHDMVEQRIQALAEQSQAQLAEVDKRLTASACSKLDFDAGQDAYEKRIDALESWLLQVEEKTSSSDKAVGSRLDAMASDVQMSLTATKENLNGTLRKLASGVKAQIDSVEAKVLGILKQHTELFDEKLRLTVGRGEFDEFVANVSGRTLALEESIQATLEEASTRASATQETVVQLQKQWSDAHHHAEKKQEPLTIRVPDVQIRHNTDGGGSQSKP